MDKRIFAHYGQWEDAQAGMWRTVPGVERVRYREAAAALMRDTAAFTRVSRLVVRDWPTATAVNLSTRSINRQAWLGHAACCMATRSPEDVTREAWHTLTSVEQDAANAAVDVVIAEWENNQPAAVITLICELCADRIDDEDAAVVTPDGWWCGDCAGRIEGVRVG